MTLIHNGDRDFSLGRWFPGTADRSGARAIENGLFQTPAALRNRHTNADMLPVSGVPYGYEGSGCWSLPLKGGAMAAWNTITGSGTISEANLLMGKALSAELTGSGDITEADLALIVSFAASLVGSGDLSAEMSGAVQMAANLVGSGDLTAAIGLIVSFAATLAGSGDIDADLKGLASMEANILSYGELTPEGIRDAVWGAIASQFNDAGTMGEKLNDAGAAGNPWAALLADNVDPDTFGEFVQKLLTTAKYMGLK